MRVKLSPTHTASPAPIPISKLISTSGMTGIPASALLAAIIPLFELDTYGDKPVVMMAVSADPDVEASFKAALSSGYTVRLSFLSHLFPHFLFYSSSPRYRGK